MKKSLLEKFFNAYKDRYDEIGYFIDQEIFVNPSSKELARDIEEDARAYLAADGNLYVTTAREGSRGIIHMDLLFLLGNDIAPETLKEPEGAYVEPDRVQHADTLGICMVRSETTNKFELAEAYLPKATVDNAIEPILRLFDKAKLKNPNIEFSTKVKYLASLAHFSR